MADLSEMDQKELEQKHTSAQNTQRVVAIIFGLIVLAWIILGFWRENVPVFITTLSMATILIVTTRNNTKQLAEEIENRQKQ